MPSLDVSVFVSQAQRVEVVKKGQREWWKESACWVVEQFKECVPLGFDAFQIFAFRAGVDILEVYAPVKFHTVARETPDEFSVLGAHGTKADYVQGT